MQTSPNIIPITHPKRFGNPPKCWKDRLGKKISQYRLVEHVTELTEFGIVEYTRVPAKYAGARF